MEPEVLTLPVREVMQPNYSNPEFSCNPVSSPSARFRLRLQCKSLKSMSFSHLGPHIPREEERSRVTQMVECLTKLNNPSNPNLLLQIKLSISIFSPHRSTDFIVWFRTVFQSSSPSRPLALLESSSVILQKESQGIRLRSIANARCSPEKTHCFLEAVGWSQCAYWPSSSHLILIREIRTASDHVQDDMCGISLSLSVLVEKGQACTAGNRHPFAEDGHGGKQMNIRCQVYAK
ncbi:hypothetical protein D9613_004464 [Agrocybe pediades]|uniref:Uncharacterized protein n=1 Tax=Agrocybe pediades TaxID=84607 RepID=A0A8H4VL10_9AGAR|nr:hypothetical protein D9613_004464 [Agrocybe pediades]